MSSDPTDLGAVVESEALLSPGAVYQTSAVSFDLAHYPMRGWPWPVLVTRIPRFSRLDVQGRRV